MGVLRVCLVLLAVQIVAGRSGGVGGRGWLYCTLSFMPEPFPKPGCNVLEYKG